MPKPSALVALMALGIALPAPAAAKTNWFVEVNGERYRVQLASPNEVLVFNKSAVVRWSLTERDNRVEAARRATGCETGEVLFANPRLSVRLKCPDGHSMPPAAE